MIPESEGLRIAIGLCLFVVAIIVTVVMGRMNGGDDDE